MTAIASLPFKRTQSSSAAELARRQWAGNRVALQRHQAHVIEQAGDFPADVDWVFARDGSLTCLRVYGSWWAECSVPRAAAVKLLASLDPSPLVSAYLAPAFAQLLHAARHQTGAEPALIAIVPSVETLQILLAGGDFAAEIASHRLWFVAGEDWAEELRKLFRDHPGLPPAGRFIRTKLTDTAVTEPMIAAAQDVLSEVARSRNAALQRLRSIDAGPAGTCERLMIISPSQFRLWDDAAPALEEAAAEFEAVGNGRVLRFDSDDPLNGSPLALATMAADSDAVLAANVYRADAANLVAATKPWLTWVTREPVRPFDPAAPRDRLIVATPTLAAAATRAHWPATAVVVADCQDRPAAVAALAPPHLAIIADLRTVAIPRPIEDLSSHRLLWEFIDGEVDTNPFVVGDDPVGYLLGKADEIGIAADELDVPAFVDGLIIPRWQRAVARLIVAARLPVRIYGRGWGDEPGVAIASVGPLTSRPAFERACADATALVHVWPGSADHPIGSVATPVVRAAASWNGLSQALKQALARQEPAKVARVAVIPLRHVLASLV